MKIFVMSLIFSASALRLEEEKILQTPVDLKSTMSHDEFEKAVSDLFKIGSLGLTKAEFDATPFGTSVQKIQDMIEKDMLVKVVEAHKANQIELDRLAKELQKCHDTKNSQVKTAKPSDDKYKKTSPLHKTCRTTEAGLYTEKVSLLGGRGRQKEGQGHEVQRVSVG